MFIKSHIFRVIILTFVCLCIVSKASEINKKSPEFMFVFFDAGETHALLPVVSRLNAEKKDYLVLSLGTSRSLNLGSQLNPDKVIEIDVDRNWDRYKALPENMMKAITEKIQPKMVITGVASEIQKQFASHYSSTSIIYAYYDNFGPIDNISYAPLVSEIQKHVDFFLVPSKDVAKSAVAKNTIVVGQPSLETWLARVSDIDREDVINRLQLSKDKPIITFIGGYDPEYEQVLTLFVNSVKTLPNYQVIIRPHPKTEGLLERKVIKKEQCRHCHLSQSDIDTMEAVSISDIVVCHHSTVGIQALFVGKKVIYLDIPGSNFTNPDLRSWKLSTLATNQKDFVSALENAANKVKSKDALFDLAGIPTNATERIYTLLTRQGKNNALIE